MALTTRTPNARIIELGTTQTCQPVDADGYPLDADCFAPARYAVLHTPNDTSPVSYTLRGQHAPLCQTHAREQIARCLTWKCRGATTR